MVGIEHVGIFSNDTAALKDWYIDMFGWKVVYDNGKGTFFLKADDGGMIEFCKTDIDGGKQDMKATGIRHIAISVSDFDGMVKKLMASFFISYLIIISYHLIQFTTKQFILSLIHICKETI